MDKKQQIIELFNQYVIPNYTRQPIVFEQAHGVWVTDVDKNHYLDLFSGWAVTSIGHCHPRLVEAVREQAGQIMYMPNIYYTAPQGLLARRIGEATGWGGQSFFCNSGAESVEGAIKLARLATAPERHRIITFKRGFHGRTLATLTATPQPKFQQKVGPLPEGFDYATYNDLDSVREVMTDQTAAVLVEPIQGEGGIWPATKEFMQGLRKLCDDNGVMLICDEVWTGVGRTGKWFGHQQYDIVPDIMTLAKGVGGGAVLGAVVARPSVAKALVPGMHATTYGGSALVCAAGLTVFQVIEDEGLLENTVKMGGRFVDGLKKLQQKDARIKEIRAVGLMIGVELTVPGAPVVQAALEEQLLINCTHETILRIAPSLNITAEEVDEGLARLERALAAVEVAAQ